LQLQIAIVQFFSHVVVVRDFRRKTKRQAKNVQKVSSCHFEKTEKQKRESQAAH
jgi:hypothetical protein